MKFCSKCGSQLGEGIRFCATCGTPVPVEEATSQIQEKAPEAAPVEATEALQQEKTAPSNEQSAPHAATAQPAPVFAQPMLPSAIRILKALGTSPLFLVGVIAFTLNLFMTFINSFSGASNIVATIYRIASALDLEYMLADVLEDLYRFAATGNVLGTLVGMMPGIIIAIGLWMTYGACASKAPKKLGTAGLTMIKVLTIINLVFVCLALVIGELLLFVGLIAALDSFAGTEGAMVIGVIMIFVLLCMVLSIVYYAKVIKSLNAAKNTAITGRPFANASIFVGVLCFISAVCSIIGIIPTTVTAAAGFAPIGVFFANLITTICSATMSICFGALIFKYRSQMKSIQMQMYAPQPPVYGVNQNW